MATKTEYPKWFLNAIENEDTSPEYQAQLTTGRMIMLGCVSYADVEAACLDKGVPFSPLIQDAARKGDQMLAEIKRLFPNHLYFNKETRQWQRTHP